MKNNFKSILYCIIIFFSLFSVSLSDEEFIFNVTEIEILENGNKVNGYKGGTVTTKDGDIILAEEFSYINITNIIEAICSVKFIYEINHLTIFSDKAIYLKNEEKVITKGNSKAIDKKNTITANEFYYDKSKNILNAKNNVEIIDIEKDIQIISDDITYLKNEEKVITKEIRQ